jgi:hypothetical protein
VTDNTDAGLPYFEEYLQAVLRPRVERLLSRQTEDISAQVWAALVKSVLAEQRPGSPITADNVERLLRESLGLSIEARVEASFGDGGSAAAAPTNGGGAVAERGANGEEVINRRPMSPLVRAVAGPRRG